DLFGEKGRQHLMESIIKGPQQGVWMGTLFSFLQTKGWNPFFSMDQIKGKYKLSGATTEIATGTTKAIIIERKGILLGYAGNPTVALAETRPLFSKVMASMWRDTVYMPLIVTGAKVGLEVVDHYVSRSLGVWDHAMLSEGQQLFLGYLAFLRLPAYHAMGKADYYTHRYMEAAKAGNKAQMADSAGKAADAAGATPGNAARAAELGRLAHDAYQDYAGELTRQPGQEASAHGAQLAADRHYSNTMDSIQKASNSSSIVDILRQAPDLTSMEFHLKSSRENHLLTLGDTATADQRAQLTRIQDYRTEKIDDILYAHEQGTDEHEAFYRSHVDAEMRGLAHVDADKVADRVERLNKFTEQHGKGLDNAQTQIKLSDAIDTVVKLRRQKAERIERNDTTEPYIDGDANTHQDAHVQAHVSHLEIEIPLMELARKAAERAVELAAEQAAVYRTNDYNADLQLVLAHRQAMDIAKTMRDGAKEEEHWAKAQQTTDAAARRAADRGRPDGASWTHSRDAVTASLVALKLMFDHSRETSDEVRARRDKIEEYLKQAMDHAPDDPTQRKVLELRADVEDSLQGRANDLAKQAVECFRNKEIDKAIELVHKSVKYEVDGKDLDRQGLLDKLIELDRRVRENPNYWKDMNKIDAEAAAQRRSPEGTVAGAREDHHSPENLLAQSQALKRDQQQTERELKTARAQYKEAMDRLNSDTSEDNFSRADQAEQRVKNLENKIKEIDDWHQEFQQQLQQADKLEALKKKIAEAEQEHTTAAQAVEAALENNINAPTPANHDALNETYSRVDRAKANLENLNREQATEQRRAQYFRAVHSSQAAPVASQPQPFAFRNKIVAPATVDAAADIVRGRSIRTTTTPIVKNGKVVGEIVEHYDSHDLQAKPIARIDTMHGTGIVREQYFTPDALAMLGSEGGGYRMRTDGKLLIKIVTDATAQIHESGMALTLQLADAYKAGYVHTNRPGAKKIVQDLTTQDAHNYTEKILQAPGSPEAVHRPGETVLTHPWANGPPGKESSQVQVFAARNNAAPPQASTVDVDLLAFRDLHRETSEQLEAYAHGQRQKASDKLLQAYSYRFPELAKEQLQYAISQLSADKVKLLEVKEVQRLHAVAQKVTGTVGEYLDRLIEKHKGDLTKVEYDEKAALLIKLIQADIGEKSFNPKDAPTIAQVSAGLAAIEVFVKSFREQSRVWEAFQLMCAAGKTTAFTPAVIAIQAFANKYKALNEGKSPAGKDYTQLLVVPTPASRIIVIDRMQRMGLGKYIQKWSFEPGYDKAQPDKVNVITFDEVKTRNSRGDFDKAIYSAFVDEFDAALLGTMLYNGGASQGKAIIEGGNTIVIDVWRKSLQRAEDMWNETVQAIEEAGFKRDSWKSGKWGEFIQNVPGEHDSNSQENRYQVKPGSGKNGDLDKKIRGIVEKAFDNEWKENGKDAKWREGKITKAVADYIDAMMMRVVQEAKKDQVQFIAGSMAYNMMHPVAKEAYEGQVLYGKDRESPINARGEIILVSHPYYELMRKEAFKNPGSDAARRFEALKRGEALEAFVDARTRDTSDAQSIADAFSKFYGLVGYSATLSAVRTHLKGLGLEEGARNMGQVYTLMDFLTKFRDENGELRNLPVELMTRQVKGGERGEATVYTLHLLARMEEFNSLFLNKTGEYVQRRVLEQINLLLTHKKRGGQLFTGEAKTATDLIDAAGLVLLRVVKDPELEPGQVRTVRKTINGREVVYYEADRKTVFEGDKQLGLEPILKGRAEQGDRKTVITGSAHEELSIPYAKIKTRENWSGPKTTTEQKLCMVLGDLVYEAKILQAFQRGQVTPEASGRRMAAKVDWLVTTESTNNSQYRDRIADMAAQERALGQIRKAEDGNKQDIADQVRTEHKWEGKSVDEIASELNTKQLALIKDMVETMEKNTNHGGGVQMLIEGSSRVSGQEIHSDTHESYTQKKQESNQHLMEHTIGADILAKEAALALVQKAEQAGQKDQKVITAALQARQKYGWQDQAPADIAQALTAERKEIKWEIQVPITNGLGYETVVGKTDANGRLIGAESLYLTATAEGLHHNGTLLKPGERTYMPPGEVQAIWGKGSDSPDFLSNEFMGEFKVDDLKKSLANRGIHVPEGKGLKYINAIILTNRKSHEHYSDILTAQDRKIVERIGSLNEIQLKKFNRDLIERGDTQVSPKVRDRAPDILSVSISTDNSEMPKRRRYDLHKQQPLSVGLLAAKGLANAQDILKALQARQWIGADGRLLRYNMNQEDLKDFAPQIADKIFAAVQQCFPYIEYDQPHYSLSNMDIFSNARSVTAATVGIHRSIAKLTGQLNEKRDRLEKMEKEREQYHLDQFPNGYKQLEADITNDEHQLEIAIQRRAVLRRVDAGQVIDQILLLQDRLDEHQREYDRLQQFIQYTPEKLDQIQDSLEKHLIDLGLEQFTPIAFLSAIITGEDEQKGKKLLEELRVELANLRAKGNNEQEKKAHKAKDLLDEVVGMKKNLAKGKTVQEAADEAQGIKKEQIEPTRERLDVLAEQLRNDLEAARQDPALMTDQEKEVLSQYQLKNVKETLPIVVRVPVDPKTRALKDPIFRAADNVTVRLPDGGAKRLDIKGGEIIFIKDNPETSNPRMGIIKGGIDMKTFLESDREALMAALKINGLADEQLRQAMSAIDHLRKNPETTEKTFATRLQAALKNQQTFNAVMAQNMIKAVLVNGMAAPAVFNEKEGHFEFTVKQNLKNGPKSPVQVEQITYKISVGNVSKSKFFELGLSGGWILDRLIEHGVVERAAGAYVRLKPDLDEKESVVQAIANHVKQRMGEDHFGKIWAILQSSQEGGEPQAIRYNMAMDAERAGLAISKRLFKNTAQLKSDAKKPVIANLFDQLRDKGWYVKAGDDKDEDKVEWRMTDEKEKEWRETADKETMLQKIKADLSGIAKDDLESFLNVLRAHWQLREKLDLREDRRTQTIGASVNDRTKKTVYVVDADNYDIFLEREEGKRTNNHMYVGWVQDYNVGMQVLAGNAIRFQDLAKGDLEARAVYAAHQLVLHWVSKALELEKRKGDRRNEDYVREWGNLRDRLKNMGEKGAFGLLFLNELGQHRLGSQIKTFLHDMRRLSTANVFPEIQKVLDNQLTPQEKAKLNEAVQKAGAKEYKNEIAKKDAVDAVKSQIMEEIITDLVKKARQAKAQAKKDSDYENNEDYKRATKLFEAINGVLHDAKYEHKFDHFIYSIEDKGMKNVMLLQGMTDDNVIKYELMMGNTMPAAYADRLHDRITITAMAHNNGEFWKDGGLDPDQFAGYDSMELGDAWAILHETIGSMHGTSDEENIALQREIQRILLEHGEFNYDGQVLSFKEEPHNKAVEKAENPNYYRALKGKNGEGEWGIIHLGLFHTVIAQDKGLIDNKFEIFMPTGKTLQDRVRMIQADAKYLREIGFYDQIPDSIADDERYAVILNKQRAARLAENFKNNAYIHKKFADLAQSLRDEINVEAYQKQVKGKGMLVNHINSFMNAGAGAGGGGGDGDDKDGPLAGAGVGIKTDKSAFAMVLPQQFQYAQGNANNPLINALNAAMYGPNLNVFNSTVLPGINLFDFQMSHKPQQKVQPPPQGPPAAKAASSSARESVQAPAVTPIPSISQAVISSDLRESQQPGDNALTIKQILNFALPVMLLTTSLWMAPAEVSAAAKASKPKAATQQQVRQVSPQKPAAPAEFLSGTRAAAAPAETGGAPLSPQSMLPGTKFSLLTGEQLPPDASPVKSVGEDEVLSPGGHPFETTRVYNRQCIVLVATNANGEIFKAAHLTKNVAQGAREFLKNLDKNAHIDVFHSGTTKIPKALRGALLQDVREHNVPVFPLPLSNFQFKAQGRQDAKVIINEGPWERTMRYTITSEGIRKAGPQEQRGAADLSRWVLVAAALGLAGLVREIYKEAKNSRDHAQAAASASKMFPGISNKELRQLLLKVADS
ncbi:MAG: hypothetical protein HY591_05875, partial [Candidatus Omnitrophica bacterium]|nr:hypothetical protein [Candidatus Omnitrophota bacterium]